MKGFPAKAQVEAIRARYPEGTKVKMIEMEADTRPVPPGTIGTVRLVDDIGTVHTDWQNGSALGFIPGVDRVTILADA